MTDHANAVIQRVRAGLTERRHVLGRDFDCHAAARQIAERYLSAADGASGFWISRPRLIAEGRSTRAVYEVLRSDGRIGVWDALTFQEGEEIADVLTSYAIR